MKAVICSALTDSYLESTTFIVPPPNNNNNVERIDLLINKWQGPALGARSCHLRFTPKERS